MTDEQMIAALRPDLVFELSYRGENYVLSVATPFWRAFYKVRPGTGTEGSARRDYRHADGATALEAVANAVVAAARDKLND